MAMLVDRKSSLRILCQRFVVQGGTLSGGWRREGDGDLPPLGGFLLWLGWETRLTELKERDVQ